MKHLFFLYYLKYDEFATSTSVISMEFYKQIQNKRTKNSVCILISEFCLAYYQLDVFFLLFWRFLICFVAMSEFSVPFRTKSSKRLCTIYFHTILNAGVFKFIDWLYDVDGFLLLFLKVLDSSFVCCAVYSGLIKNFQWLWSVESMRSPIAVRQPHCEITTIMLIKCV